MMRAVRLNGPGSARVEDVPQPEPGPGEVAVAVTTAAVCGTDRKLVARGEPVGHVPGHEVAGRLAGGIPVGVHPDTGCGRCPMCSRGQHNRCADKRSVGVDRDGGLAETVVVPTAHAVTLDGIDATIAPLLEPLACCVHAVRRLRVEPGENALVVGAGAMGVLTMWTLQAEGLHVHVCQRSERRRRLVATLGASSVFGPDDDPAAHLPAPPTVVVVTAPGAAPLQWALDVVAPGGRVHAFAGTPGGAEVDANTVHYRHLELVGSTGSGLSDYHRAAELARSGEVDLDRLPCRVVGLDQAPAALSGPPDPDHLRTVVDLTGSVAR